MASLFTRNVPYVHVIFAKPLIFIAPWFSRTASSLIPVDRPRFISGMSEALHGWRPYFGGGDIRAVNDDELVCAVPQSC
jgi:hypothetical protein